MTNQLAGLAMLPADSFGVEPAAKGNDGDGNPISADEPTAPFDGQPRQDCSRVQVASEHNLLHFNLVTLRQYISDRFFKG